jgi:hypothetical protein
MRSWIAAIILCLVLPSSAYAQGALTLQTDLDHSNRARHRDPLGKPCLDIEAASRAHRLNPNVYDHVISVVNRCSIIINFRLCYFGTQHCIEMTANGYKRVDAILGVNPGMQKFRYDVYERF